MSVIRLGRVILILSVAVGVAALGGFSARPLHGQNLKVQVKMAAPTVPGAEKDEPRPEGFNFRIDDKRAPKIIESVVKHLKPDLPADEWKDIITNLQALLDDPNPPLVEWTDPLSKTGKPSVPRNVKAVANVLIGRFSKQGLDFYQREFGAEADRRLKEAIERGDYGLMSLVSNRYFHTKAGAEATVLLGRFELDRGHYREASATFLRYLDRNPEDQVPVSVTFLAALAFKRLSIEAAMGNNKTEKENYEKKATECWDKVQKDVGNKEVAFGLKKVRLEQLKAEFEKSIVLKPARKQDERSRAFGDIRNNAQGIGGRPFLDADWQFSLTPVLEKVDQDTKGSGMRWIDQNLKLLMQSPDKSSNHPPLPQLFPVASVGKIIFRTYDGVYCLATRDDPKADPPIKAGDMLWWNDLDSSLFKMVNTPPQQRAMDEWKNYYQISGPRGIFFENGLIGSLSHDGSTVYFVDDIAVPPHPQHQQNQMNIQAMNGQQGASFSPAFNKMVYFNKLCAVDMDSGKLKWKTGGKSNTVESKPVLAGDKEPPSTASFFQNCYFLGAPMPLGGKLYVVIEKEKELQLVCINPDPAKMQDRDPEVVWHQPLGSPFVALPTDTLRRIQGIQLAYSENVIVVPTNAGAVLGVDLMSHGIIWARPYKQSQSPVMVPDLNQPQFRIRGGMPQPNPNMALNADRWRTSTPIISGGRVVFTAYDSNSLMCLNLRDGEIVWETARSSDDLYVAGVFENKVLVVGKSTVKFLDLNSGAQLGAANTGMPSGIGTASNDIYFLPIRPSPNNVDPEIVSIDIKQMKVVAHTHSRKRIPMGNLLFFDGAMFSQTPTHLTAFPQLVVKKAEAKKRLDANRDDPIGLAEYGDLELDDGHLEEAINLFNRCLKNNPTAETKHKAREKLYDAITDLLQQDFNTGEKMLDQYKDLCEVPVLDGDDPLVRQHKTEERLRRKSNYFCLVAKGKESQGKLVEAFDNYMEFGTQAGNKELVNVIDQPNTFASPPVWVRGRISHMLKNATPEQRKPLEEKAAKQWADVKKDGELEKLRKFVSVFGLGFAAGNEARLVLAEKLIMTKDEDDIRDAENIFLSLKGLEDDVFAARATDGLGRLYIHKGLFDDAMALYSELNRKYGNVIIRDNKTGSDLFNELITDKRLLPYLEPLHQTWNYKKLKGQEINTNSFSQPEQSFTITPSGELGPFFNRYKIVMDTNRQGSPNWSFRVVDRSTGEERFRSQPFKSPEYFWTQPFTNNHRFAQVRGHMLLLNLSQKVYAFDLADNKKLWEKDLLGDTPLPNVLPRVENEADGVRLYYQDGWSQKVGQVGLLESSYVCLVTRDGLKALDPAKGTVLWTKANVSSRVQLIGDENHVFIFESNAEGGISSIRAVRSADGVEIQIKDPTPFLANMKRAKTFGRRVLVFDDKSEKKSIRLYDILMGKFDWTKEITGNPLLLNCEDPNLTGYVSDNGDVVVINLKDGAEVFKQKLDATKMAQHLKRVDNPVLLLDHERFYVVLNRPIDNNINLAYNSSLTPGIRAVRVNGSIYCFDRATQKRLWFTDEQFDNQQIILEQFQDMPIILGAHWYNRINNGLFEGSGLKVVAIDKRTGSALFRKDVEMGGAFFALDVNHQKNYVELIRTGNRIRFAPDDGKATSSLTATPVGEGPRMAVPLKQATPIRVAPPPPKK